MRKITKAQQTATAAQTIVINRMIKEIDSSTRNQLTFQKLPGGFLKITEYDRSDRTKVAVEMYPNGDMTDPVVSSF